MQYNESEGYIKYINDYAHKGFIGDKKKINRFSIKSTLKFESTVKSAKSFRSLGKMTKNIFNNVRLKLNIWQYIPQINPLGQFRIIWDIFFGSSILYIFYAISMSVSFARRILLDYLYVFIILSIMGILIDLNTSYYEQGILVKNRKLVTMNYLKKYFVFDLISLICLIDQAFNDDLQYVIILFFLKGIHFSKISKIFKEVLHIKPIFHSIVSFIKLISVIIFAAHFFACIYIIIVTYFDFSQNWVQKQGLELNQTFKVYVRAFYYSCVTMLTVGYGDVTPQNDLEYSIVILTVLIGCIFFGYSLNKIGSIFNEMEEQDKKILKNLFIINQYMSRKDIQKDLQFQVREYLTYYWSQNNSTENKAQEQIISQLSEGLKQKLQIQATRKVLNQCPIFRQNFTDEFLQKASTLIKEYRCYPDEIITFQGDVDDCAIFFVEQGTAVMYFQGNSNILGKNDTSVDIKELKKGDNFGFHSFFTGQPRKLTIKSSGFTSLLLIERIAFIKLIRQYPQDYEIYCTISDNLQTGQNYQQVHSDCFCCNYSDHMITDCPKIHLAIDKIELSQRDLKQVRNKEYERQNKRSKVIFDESQVNQFIQDQLFYLQAYHQLFIGAFVDWFNSDDEDEEDDENDNYTSYDKVSIVQDLLKLKKNDSNQMQIEEDFKQRSSLSQQDGNSKINFNTQNEKRNTRTSSLTKIKNSSFSCSDESYQQQQYQMLIQKQQQQQNQAQLSLENSTAKYTTLFSERKPSLQINVYNDTHEDHQSPKKSKKKSLGESFSDLEKVQSQLHMVQGYDKVQSQQQIQQALQQKSVTQQIVQPLQLQTQYQSPQQQNIQQLIQQQQITLQQQFQYQQQLLNQQLQQIIQATTINSQINSPQQNPQTPLNFNGTGWPSAPQTPQLRRRSSTTATNIIGQQNHQQHQNLIFQLKNVFPGDQNKNQQQQEISLIGKSTHSIPNLNPTELIKQHSQNSLYKNNKTYTQQQTSYMPQEDKFLLLQKLNNNMNNSQIYEEDCKMKSYDHYFPEWNFNFVLQKINIDNGFSVNSSDIVQTTDRKGMKLSYKQSKTKQLGEQTISNKRVTSIVYQNANEKKVQEALTQLNQTTVKNTEEQNMNDHNSIVLPVIPNYIRELRKGNTVVIPSIQEQNQQLAALKFTHQSVNDKFIVFRKNKQKSQNEQDKLKMNYLSSEQINTHQEKLKAMKRKSISVDIDLLKKLKPTSNQIIATTSEHKGFSNQISLQNISTTKNTLFGITLENSRNQLDMSENIVLNDNEDSRLPITINLNGGSQNNSWAQYVNQKH